MSLSHSIRTQDSIQIAEFSGRIMSESDLTHFVAEFSKLLEGSSALWIFDLNGLSHINSTGINFIIRSLTKTRVNQGDLILCRVEGNVKTLFEIAKINEIFSIYEDIDSAINHFNDN